MSEQKHRKKLNAEQLEVLELLYKFRFGSNDLIAQYFGKRDRSFVFKRLSILLEQGLIGKRFDSSYRIQGKPAAYYLLPAGIKKLSEYRDIEVTITRVKMAYKDKTVSEDFISHCLQALGAFNQLKRIYGDAIRFYTKVDLNVETYDYFPKPLPDAFLSLKEQDQTRRYFLEILDAATPLFVLRKRIKQYLDYYESGAWDDTGSEFPIVLLVCQSNKQEKQLQSTISKALENETEPVFATTTYAKLKELSKEVVIWQNAIDLDEVHDLRSIS
jgi:hypothetical protein